MKPPICEVCHKRFGPDEGGLVRCRTTDAGRAFDERRRARPGFVGHPPDTGWFCGAHVEGARQHADRTLGEVVALLREAT